MSSWCATYCHPPCLVHAKSIRCKKHLSGFKLPPIVIRSFPQFSIECCWATCTSCTDSLHSIFRCNRSVLLTYSIANRLCFTWDIGARNCTPCPFASCAYNIMMLITHHPAWDASLPSPKPCILISTVEPAKSFESLYAVWKKNFISWIVSDMAATTVSSTPKDWKISDAIACAIYTIKD